jgi:proteasome assembly chaperone (PAC2) family protein
MKHIEFIEQPELRRPLLVCAFRGWNDGGQAATIAARFLVKEWEARLFAHLDPEEFYDFQVTRPMVRLENGVSRVIEWPKAEFWTARVTGRDVVIYIGAEPNVRWRTFCDTFIEMCRHLGTTMVVTLGGFLTDVPHTRPVPVVGSAADEEAAGRLGLARSQYEGPTGIVGVIHDVSNREGIPSVSLWAAVPHYLHQTENPKAGRALAERAAKLLELPLDTSALQRRETEWVEEVSQFIADNEELAEYITRLESAAEEEVGRERFSDQPIPSGDSIAAELERFLREQDGHD